MLWLLSSSLVLLGYAYAGYPGLIWGVSRMRGRRVKRGEVEGGVAVLMAAHNEEGVLPGKMAQLLELAKREPIREIWVGLDGCTDGTGERVREELGKLNIQYSISNDQCSSVTEEGRPVVHVVEFEKRRGKAAVLNELMGRATQPFFVMMDARQRVEEGAIGKLLANFADPQVGVVSGALVYESAVSGVQKGAESYWGYEKWIRESESSNRIKEQIVRSGVVYTTPYHKKKNRNRSCHNPLHQMPPVSWSRTSTLSLTLTVRGKV